MARLLTRPEAVIGSASPQPINEARGRSAVRSVRGEVLSTTRYRLQTWSKPRGPVSVCFSADFCSVLNARSAELRRTEAQKRTAALVPRLWESTASAGKTPPILGF
jgi:hypothetical protein